MSFLVLIELFPNSSEKEGKKRLHHEIFKTEAAAHEYVNDARRQNLPFKNTWVCPFEDRSK